MKTLAERVLKWNQQGLFGSIADTQKVYEPIWECAGEIFSEYDCFFLIMIGETPGITVNELKEKGGRTQGAVSQRLIKFEERGLIRKARMETDRRYTQVWLTPKGEQVAERVTALKIKHSQDVVDMFLEQGYTEEQIGLFLEMYEAVEVYSDSCKERYFQK